MYTVTVKTDGTKTVQSKRNNELFSFELHLIIDFVLTERKLAYGPVKFPARSISHFAMNIIMAKTGSTAEANSATRSLCPNTELQLCKPPVWPRFSNSNRRIYMVTDGLQYCDHLRPTPEGSVRWYTQRAASMCMCMSPRARWKMVHRSYLYVLSVSVMQAGVTCTSFSNYTA